MKKYNRLVKIKIQVGIFNYLANRGYKPREIKNIVESYGIDILKIEKPTKGKVEWFKSIETMITDDFNSFKKFVKDTYRIKPVNKLNNDYSDWYDESSTDGSFAYNNSADDF